MLFALRLLALYFQYNIIHSTNGERPPSLMLDDELAHLFNTNVMIQNNGIRGQPLDAKPKLSVMNITLNENKQFTDHFNTNVILENAIHQNKLNTSFYGLQHILAETDNLEVHKSMAQDNQLQNISSDLLHLVQQNIVPKEKVSLVNKKKTTLNETSSSVLNATKETFTPSPEELNEVTPEQAFKDDETLIKELHVYDNNMDSELTIAKQIRDLAKKYYKLTISNTTHVREKHKKNKTLKELESDEELYSILDKLRMIINTNITDPETYVYDENLRETADEMERLLKELKRQG